MPGETGGGAESPTSGGGEWRTPIERANGFEPGATEHLPDDPPRRSLARELGRVVVNAPAEGAGAETSAEGVESAEQVEARDEALALALALALAEPAEAKREGLAAQLAGLERDRPERIEQPAVEAERLEGRHRNRVEPERYLDPGADVQADLAAVVRETGTGDGWERMVPRINPRFNGPFETQADQLAWQANCGDCARSFADTYQGVETRAAWGDGRRNGERAAPGENREMWEWAGSRAAQMLSNDDVAGRQAFTDDAWAKLESALNDAPVDSVAIIAVGWERRDRFPDPDGVMPVRGHFFNAVKRADGVHWVDAQSGETGGWPPGYSGAIRSMEAIVRRPGARWGGVQL